MPFDALVAAPAANRSPTRSSASTDRRFPGRTWRTHKLAQQRKFGPSFWYRHQAAMSVGLVVASPVVGAVVGASQGFTPHSSALTVASSFVWMCLIALITGTGSHQAARRVALGGAPCPPNYLGGELAVPEAIASGRARACNAICRMRG